MHVRVFFQLCNMWWMCLPLAEIAWSVFTSLLPRSSMNRSYLLWKWAHALFKGSWPSVLVLVSSVWLKKRKNEQMRASQKQPLKFAQKKKQAFFLGGGESFMGSLQHHQGAQQHNSSSKHDRVCRHCWFALCSSCFWWAEPHRRFVRGTSYRGGGLHDLATHSPPPHTHTHWYWSLELFLQWTGAENYTRKVLIPWWLWGIRSQYIEWYMTPK